jgi:antitoxin FitA
MAQVTIRNIDDAVIARLKRKAALHGRSLEQQLRLILTEAAPLTPKERLAIADEIAAMTPGPLADDSTDLIREDRDSR